MARQQRRDYGKKALVLAGGGLTGFVYEVGALRAVDDLLVGMTVNDFDIYVGTSAGSIVGACLANNVSSATLMSMIDRSSDDAPAIDRSMIFSPNYGELLSRLLRMPVEIARGLPRFARHWRDTSTLDLALAAADLLPSGLYDSTPMEQYLRENLLAHMRVNEFVDLQKQLYVIATDLDSGQRVVFGESDAPKATISQAVAASAALPLVYKPFRIGDCDYIDGGVRGSASLDVAIEHGADLIVCINPLAPFQNTRKGEPEQRLGGYLSDRGMQAIGSQVFRTMLHAGLKYHIKQLERMHPEVDIILIEPRADDYKMFYFNPMRYSARLVIARHGYESVMVDLAAAYHFYKDILARHGVSITRQKVAEQLDIIQGDRMRSDQRQRHARRVDATAGSHVSDDLARALDVLETRLAAIDHGQDPPALSEAS